MEEKEWLTTEKLVQLIEKSIDKDSTVEHNVKLPDLSSKISNLRQCDLVIKSGQEPRQTITIVEIQHRNKKFDLNTFQGLTQKMKDVGAQHLICVSTTGFTSTIKEKARDTGGTIRLITLKRYDTEKIPFRFFNFTANQIIPNYTLNAPYNVIAEHSDHTKKVPINDSLFILSDLPHLLTAQQLISYYFTINKPEIDGNYEVKLPFNGQKLEMIHENNTYNILSFTAYIGIQTTSIKIPINTYDYNQEETGSIAWALEGSFNNNGTKRKVILNVVPGIDSEFMVTGMQLEYETVNNPNNLFETLSLRKISKNDSN